jgi:predicted HTH domain antitoxin
MQVLLEVPDDIVHKLEAGWADLPRHALEALAVQAYRSDLLTAAEVQRMLGLASRWETDELLKSAGAYLDYSEEDFRQDVETLQRLA